MSTAERRYPRWFGTLYVTDTLERFGFYGMQAILVLYAAAPVSQGGLGLGKADAASLFGAWIALMFLLSMPGGWLGDRVLGQRRALLLGTSIGMAGYLVLAIPAGGVTTAVGLVLLALGGGLFKPNHQAMINLMYRDDIARREAGISMIYTGVQASALVAPLLTGYLGERVSWNLGFSVAGIATAVAALLLARATAQFEGVGSRPGRPLDAAERRTWINRTVLVVGVLAALLLGAGLGGRLSATMAIGLSGLLSVICPILGYRALKRNKSLSDADRRRLRGFLAVFLGATLFWMIIAHAASLLNLFAQHHIDRDVFGWTVPASWLQAAVPVFILVLAPVFAALLPRIGKRDNVGVKFAIGLSLVGGSFILMGVAAAVASGGHRISPLWLLAVYLAHACGELIVAAVSVAAAGSVLPRQFMARTLGLLWLFAALGGGLGAGVVRLADVVPEPAYYAGLGTFAVAAGLAFALGRKRLTAALSTSDDPVALPVVPDGPELAAA